MHVTLLQQCSLQEKITKHRSPLPSDFSISTMLNTASKSAPGTAVRQREGKRSHHIISSVVGYLSASPVRNLSRLRASHTYSRSCGFSEGVLRHYLGTRKRCWNLRHLRTLILYEGPQDRKASKKVKRA